MTEATVQSGVPFSGLGFDLAPVSAEAARMSLMGAECPTAAWSCTTVCEQWFPWGYGLMLLHGQETGAS